MCVHRGSGVCSQGVLEWVLGWEKENAPSGNNLELLKFICH